MRPLLWMDLESERNTMSSLNGTSKRDRSGVVTEYREHSGAIEKIVWGSTGESIISCDVMGVVRTWKVRSGATLASCACSQEAVRDIAMSADGKAVAVCDDDGTVRVWDIVTGKLLTAYDGHTEAPLSVSWSPDGTQVVSAQRNAAHIWYPWEEERMAYSGHTDIVWTLAFSPDGKRVASGGYDTAVRVWDVASGKTLYPFRGHRGWVNSVAWSPDGVYIASGDGDRGVLVWVVGKA